MPMRRRVLLTQDEPIGLCRRSDRREKQVNAQGLSRPGALNQHKIPQKVWANCACWRTRFVIRPHFLPEFRHL
jgi:hypothetical protein